MDGHIERLLHMLGKMYQWCVATFSSGLCHIPRPVHQVLESLIIQMYVKINALCEQWWPPNSIQEEIWAHVAATVLPRTIGNPLLAVGLKLCVPLARLPLTPRHRQVWLPWCHERVDWRVEWHSVVFSDEYRFCLYVSD